MKLEQQVTSLELGQKLKELGVKQESLFYWADGQIVTMEEIPVLAIYTNDLAIWENMEQSNSLDTKDYYSAFTAAELGELLPEKLNKEPLPHLLTIKRFGQWEIYYQRNSADFIAFESDKNLANTLAKMLIYLFENKLI